MQRVLLLELLSTDRFSQDGSIGFPFLAGLARDRAVPCRWGCFGFDPAAQAPDRFTVGLDAADLERLRAAAREHGATRIVVSSDLAPPVRRALADACPGADILRADGTAVLDGAAAEEVLGLARSPGAPPPRRLEDAVVPSYACELWNPLAERIRPFVHVVAGPECLYARPLRLNRAFAAVAGEGEPLPSGCSFCIRPPTRVPFATPVVDLAIRQIRAAARELPAARRSGEHIVRGALLVFRLRAFVDALLEAPLPPSTFLFSTRADELLRMAGAIDDALPRLAAAGHALHVASMGAENFSPAENERFNKGVTPAQLEEAVRRMRAWERAWPGTFAFFALGGFGHITFTPWTTLDDLALNAEAARRLDLEVGALFLGSRAILLPGTPLALLARRDGFVADRFPDAAMARIVPSSCIKSPDVVEIPWRFAHPEVGAIYATILRVVEPWCEVLRDDPATAPARALARELQATLEDGPERPRRLFELLVAAARANPDVASPEALLGAALRAPPPLRARPHGEAPGEPGVDGWAGVEALRRAGSRPGGPLHGFEVTSAALRSERGVPELTVRLRRGSDRLALALRPADGFPRPFLRGRRAALTYLREGPADGPEKASVARAVLRLVEDVGPPWQAPTPG